MNAVHDEFKRKFALAVLTTADDSNAPIHELTGLWSTLKAECKRRQAGASTLSKMKSPGHKQQRLEVSDDRWRFNKSGANEYASFIAEARSQLAISP